MTRWSSSSPLCRQAADAFRRTYGRAPELVAISPGRLEVLGNHTDTNGGLALGCAVDRGVAVALAPGSGPRPRLHSLGYTETPRALDALDALPAGDWLRRVAALEAELATRLGPEAETSFDACLVSDLPPGAGLSSSAAFAVALLRGRLAMHDTSLGAIALAELVRDSEQRATGALVGLLDPLCCALGAADHLMRLDFGPSEGPSTRRLALPGGPAFVIINSGVKHDLSKQYNDRRASCEAALKRLRQRTPELSSLCELDLESWSARATELPDELPDELRRRAAHPIEECARVRAAEAALASGDLVGFGAQLDRSHESSRTNFENSCPELDAIVALAGRDERALGARLSGGGFGGVALVAARPHEAEALRTALVAGLRGRLEEPIESFVVRAADGAGVFALGRSEGS